MSIKNTSSTYGSVTHFFHWTIFLLVLIMVPLGYFMGEISDKALRGQVINIHKLIGVLILVLMLLRVVWAMINVKPALPFQTPMWQRVAERSMHFALYLGLIIMPMSGLIGSIAAGYPPHWGNIYVELPIGLNKQLSDFSFDYIHEPLAIILIVLISIHLIAAMYHHFIKRDDVLRRMLTSKPRRWI